MGSIKEGARQAVENCLKVKAGEKIVIITDKETFRIGSAIKQVVKRITTDIRFFVMEDFGERPLKFPDQIGKTLQEADVSFYIAQGAKGEFQTFRKPMIEIVEANKKLRHGHMIGITKQIMKDGMCSDYQDIQRISRLVYQKVHKAKKIKVTTEKGTDIVAQFSSRLKWVICDGNITGENWSNLPDGEVFTSPSNINGTVVIDGCLGDFFTEKYGSLEKTPVTIRIENGKAIPGSIKCENQKLEEELTEYIFRTDKNSNRVGEFALGTNSGLKKLIGNLVQDEKLPGVHIAFGSPLPTHTGADWDSDAHVDCVIKNPTVYVGDEIIMEKGKYLLEDKMGFNLEKLLIDVFNPQKNETVLVMCDLPHDDIQTNKEWLQRLEMAKEWQGSFGKLGRQVGFKVYPLLFYLATGAHSAPLPKYGKMRNEEVIIEKVLKKTNVCVALTEYSATASLIGFTKKFRTLRVASMPIVSKAMEKTALAADYKEVARKCAILSPKLTRAIGALVEFSTGHRFYFDLRNRVAEEDNGMCHKDKPSSGLPLINLPSGEVFSAPYEGEDEKIGVSKTEGLVPVKYREELVVYRVRQNKIIEVLGEGSEAEQKKEYFAKDKGRKNIAELGLGLNDKAIVTGNALEDEKAGFHWAYGLSEHLGGKTGLADFESPENAVHQDIVYAKGSPIMIKKLILKYPDGSQETIIQDGEYLLF